MKRSERYEKVLAYFREQMPEVQTELEFGSVFQLLVAVVLSAQCTDKRIQEVFTFIDLLFPDVQSFLVADLVKLVFLELLVAGLDNLLVMQRVRNIAKESYVVVCCQ